MIIQLNADNNLDIHAEFGDTLKEMLTNGLSHYSEHITRLEVHLSDKNSGKHAPNDKRCMLEARLEGKQPIAVTAEANTYEQAAKAATDKLKALLQTIIGRQRNH